MNVLEFALKIIKGECNNHDDCCTCPLRLDDVGTCAITNDIPGYWNLKCDREDDKKDSLFEESED